MIWAGGAKRLAAAAAEQWLGTPQVHTMEARGTLGKEGDKGEVVTCREPLKCAGGAKGSVAAA
eukprot:6341994-Karenia_brevis.AAC.1